jgi:putative FmdB family regulatory protein
MPIYAYFCKTCKSEKDVIKQMSKIDENVFCDCCGEGSTKTLMERRLTCHKSKPFEPYWDENLTTNEDDSPKYITSWKQRTKIMRECGLEEANPRPIGRRVKFKNIYYGTKFSK